jgi:iron complex outermembrane recepter protein
MSRAGMGRRQCVGHQSVRPSTSPWGGGSSRWILLTGFSVVALVGFPPSHLQAGFVGSSLTSGGGSDRGSELSFVSETVTERIEGRILDASREDRPVGGATVTLQRRDAEDFQRVSGTVSDREGWFHFEGVDEGPHVLVIEAPGFGRRQVEIQVPRSEALRVELRPDPLWLEGVVTSASPLGSGVTYQAAQSLDRTDLVRRMDSSMGAILDGESGVAMRSFGVATARPVIRGFDGDRVLVLEDGQRMGDLSETAADHAIALDPAHVRRAEIVRGPASLLYGSSALGGVVNLLTDDIPTDWSRGLSGSVLSHGATVNRSATGAVRGLWGHDRWAVGSRVSARNAGDVRTPEARLPGTHIRSVDGQVGSAFDGSMDGRVLRGGFSLSFEDRSYGVPEGIDDPDEEVEIEMARQSISGRVEWEPSRPGRIEGMEARIRGTTLDQREWERALDPLGAVVDEDLELEYLQRSLGATGLLRHGPVGPLETGAVGLELRGRSLDVGGDEAFTPGVVDRTVAFYTFQERPLTARSRLQFGARLEGRTSRTRPNDDFPGLRESRSSRAISWAAGLHQRFDGGWEGSVQFARAHRFPMLEELFAHGPHLGAGAYEVGDSELEDEIGHGVDLLVRRSLGWGVVEASAFGTLVDGFIAFQPTGRADPASGLPIFEYRATNAALVGLELSGAVRPFDDLELRAGVDYVRGEARNDMGTPLPTMPPLRGRFETTWEPDLWHFAATIRAVATQGRVAPQEDPTSGYTLLDLRIGRDLDASGRHLVTLRIDNATDRLHRDHLSRVEERGLPMPGRNVNLVYRWTF